MKWTTVIDAHIEEPMGIPVSPESASAKLIGHGDHSHCVQSLLCVHTDRYCWASN